MAVDWTKRPPLVENVSLLGNGKAIYAAPDGDKENARMLVGADGFHFTESDFEDFALKKLSVEEITGVSSGLKAIRSLSTNEDIFDLPAGVYYWDGTVNVNVPKSSQPYGFFYVIGNDPKLIDFVSVGKPVQRFSATKSGYPSSWSAWYEFSIPNKMQLSSPNGTIFNIAVDNDGNLKSEKEVN